jgi:hypothetical protein
MIGVEPAKVRQTYKVPEGYDPWTATALGYAGPPPGGANPQLAPRDEAPRSRRPFSEWVLSSWGQKADL